MEKTLFPENPAVDFKTRAEVCVYRGVKIYQNLSCGVQYAPVKASPRMRMSLTVPTSAAPTFEKEIYCEEIYPMHFFAKISFRGEERILAGKTMTPIREEIEKLYAEREGSLRRASTEFIVEYYSDSGELQRYPVGDGFSELDDFLSRKKNTRLTGRSEFIVRQYWESDLGVIGTEKRFSIESYLRMPVKEKNQMILDYLAGEVRAYYLNRLTESGFLQSKT